MDESPLQVYHLTGTPFRPSPRHIKHKVQGLRFYNSMCGVDEPFANLPFDRDSLLSIVTEHKTQKKM